MSACWRCGCQLPEGKLECDSSCNSTVNTEQSYQEFLRERQQQIGIDWSKVQTIQDLREIISFVWQDLTIRKNSIAHHALKRFLKEPPSDQEKL